MTLLFLFTLPVPMFANQIYDNKKGRKAKKSEKRKTKMKFTIQAKRRSHANDYSPSSRAVARRYLDGFFYMGYLDGFFKHGFERVGPTA
jgi:hypothetical protein